MTPRVAIVLLALPTTRPAGGLAQTLQQPLDGQHSVLAAALRQALATELPLKVVTTPALSEPARRLAAARDVLLIHDEADAPAVPALGLAIARGVGACPDAAGWLLLQADMPLVRAATLLAVARALSHHPVAFAQYRGRRARPVGFSAELYSDLVQLQGSDGAQRLVSRYPAQGVEVDDPGVLLQVCTADDLALAQRLRHEAALAATAR